MSDKDDKEPGQIADWVKIALFMAAASVLTVNVMHKPIRDKGFEDGYKKGRTAVKEEREDREQFLNFFPENPFIPRGSSESESKGAVDFDTDHGEILTKYKALVRRFRTEPGYEPEVRERAEEIARGACIPCHGNKIPDVDFGPLEDPI